MKEETTQDKIAQIIKEEYGNYAGMATRKFILLHGIMRTKMGDEKFLEYLEGQKRINPRPVYTPIKYQTP